MRTALCAGICVGLLAPFWRATRAQAPVRPEPERALQELEQQITFVEREYGRRDESESARARRKFSEGEIQFLLQDWNHAAMALYEAVDQRDFKAAGPYEAALFELGESLYQQGSYPAALGYFKQLLARPAPAHEREAVLRALEIEVRLGHTAVGDLVQRARAAFPGGLPPEVLYLNAKAAYQRADLAPARRISEARTAFAAVPAPYDLAAAYFQGALDVQAGNLPAATERFEHCTRLTPADAHQKEVRELCFLALGRIHGETGKYAEALDAYQEIPRDSPRFNEALYEIAWSFVKAKRYEQALRTAGIISDLAPESPLAPEAAILQGHLYLRLGRFPEALEAYNRIIDQYAPVRDELDAILTLHEDPVRYFNELIGRSEKSFDVSSILPAVAVKWATSQSEVAGALQVVGMLDSSRREIEAGKANSERILAALSRNQGLDAFPHLEEGFARAEAVENAAVEVEGALSAAVRERIPPEVRSGPELLRIAAEREALEARLRTLPRTPAEVNARVARMLARVSEASRQAFQASYLIDSCNTAISASQVWLEEHRREVQTDSQGRAEFLEEVRKHREVVARYDEELRQIQQEIARTADGVSGSELMKGEAHLRLAYRALLARERELLAPAIHARGQDARPELDRLDALRPRIDALLARGEKAKLLLGDVARGGAESLRARVLAEQAFLGRYARELDQAQEETKSLVGRIAYHSFREVRAQFYRLVLKADVGLIDVAWARKRERLEKIQKLAAQKAADVSELDEEYKPLLREVD